MSKEELDQALQQRVSQQLSKLESNMERMMQHVQGQGAMMQRMGEVVYSQ